ncbi:MAG: structural protein P5 [Bacteroidaceae bacterium]|nr:structural protein P5 [Bacteroidaceae bacterium]
MKVSRGIRNCNPLNIRRVAGTHWKGQILPLKGAGGSFCKFESMEWGIRAAFCLLHTYATKYKLTCVKDIITRWAPPTENDTQSYIRHVCLLTGYGGNQRLTEAHWPRLVRAMAKIESGADLDDETINRAWNLFTGLNS